MAELDNQRGSRKDYPLLRLMEEWKIPLTMENYLALEYPEGIPDEVPELDLPPQLQKD